MGRKPQHGESGQGLVEFAILLPVLIVLVMGIVEFGLILFNQQVITNASREGARYGIVVRTPRRTAGEIDIVVDNYIADHLLSFGTSAPETAVIPEDTEGSNFGDDLRVEVSFHYDFLVLPNFVSEWFGGLDLQAQTTMKYE